MKTDFSTVLFADEYRAIIYSSDGLSKTAVVIGGNHTKPKGLPLEQDRSGVIFCG